ncbi:hypothetical protein [Sulfitobacter sp. S190]|uniref:hypothetical protein n=1 Tax=Sulfitobacter sp. S190 TaxID=2867022 RepID=UPI0021A28F04|nr:hypothetical protein [Sulfitobacter sp. S190]UWR22418.1 hypothetical protein K3756_17435 [Sulfitobacter sp. S190]
MYDGDSFYTLSLFGRLGLVALSAVLMLLITTAAVFLMRGRRGALRLAIAAALFSGFVWLSPQVYYEYYRLILNGLPRQSVIGPPPPLDTLVGLISFTGPATLSAHALGVLFWGLVWLAWRLRSRREGAGGPGR